MRGLVSCSIFAALFLLLNLELSACHRVVEDEAAESAMAGMTSLFHSLFPVVPGHSHFFWRTDQASVHRTAPVREVIRDPDGGGGGREGGAWPWRLQIDFHKRGPDCMRKCIMQGRLHPVQCHSLC